MYTMHKRTLAVCLFALFSPAGFVSRIIVSSPKCKELNGSSRPYRSFSCAATLRAFHTGARIASDSASSSAVTFS